MLQEGGLVAFPTETVYGLGADAFNCRAVERIFAAKGRPGDNPLIVHVASWEQVELLAKEPPALLYKLGQRFWPGPLTLVVKRQEKVPAAVAAGLDTVAVRWPAHPVALALIEAANLPVAAPSANRSGRPSPTAAQHVQEDLGEEIDLLLDGGPAGIGVESTVLDLTAPVPAILRPGGVTREELEEVLGEVAVAPELAGEKPLSPGMKYRHYAPRAPLWLLPAGAGDVAEAERQINVFLRRCRETGQRAGLLLSEETFRKIFREEAFRSGERKPEGAFPEEVAVLGSRLRLAEVAASLYPALRLMDHRGVDIILAESFPEAGLGLAIMNRLRRAAQGVWALPAEEGRESS